jgi:two-component system cell cycle sensor histidine kinase/response regulator CckA
MTTMPAEPLNVLVVDDDPNLLRTLRDILRQQGYAPITASNGSDGLRLAAAAAPPAIALVDLRLPDIDGMEVVHGLRQRSQDTEVVVLTGNATVESAVGALRQHSCDYLIKPVSPKQLLETVHRAGDRWLRRRAEEALRASEERFRCLIEGIGDVVFAIDPAGTIHYASPSATRVLGFAPAELIGRRAEDVFVGSLGAVLAPARGCEPAVAAPIEVACVHRNGSHRTLQLTCNDQRDNPTLRALVLTARDVTEQRQLEQQAMLAHRLDSIGRLAGGLAHDFNNILVVVLGSTQLALLEEGLPPSLVRLLEEVKSAGERAATLTRQLLLFARRQTSAPRVFDLRGLVVESLPLLRRLIAENIAIDADADPTPVPVRADPGQVEQVLFNLAVNARDAMPRGGRLTITTGHLRLDAEMQRRHETLAPGSYALLRVADTGEGMSDEVRARALEPFFTTKEPGSGTGLGLSICYGIVQQAHGSLALVSAPGHGTAVEILFPTTTAPADAATPADVEALPTGSESVLLVEDDAAIRSVTASMLERLGYRVASAGAAQEALARVAAGHHFDLVLTDVVMPAMGGPELARALRTSRPGLRVLFMSGHLHVDGGDRDAPIENILQKPFTLRGLAVAVRRALASASP